MQTKYPTKKQITKSRIKPTKSEIELTKKWKKRWTRTEKKEKKIELLSILINLLLKHNYRNEIRVAFLPYAPACYMKDIEIIILNNESIITALHELGHILYGKNEVHACAYSTKLFKATFPDAYKNLIWKGHMLVKARLKRGR